MPDLRKARLDTPLPVQPASEDALLKPGEWFLEQRADGVGVYADPQGLQHVADLAIVVFLQGLARRDIVFVSWG